MISLLRPAALLPTLGLLAAALPAEAHVGNVPAKATFYLPPPPQATPTGDGGTRWSLSPADADQHYLLAWQDGDNDPTGRFTFYYADHAIPVAAPPEFVDARDAKGEPTGGVPIGKVVVEVGGREAREVWVGCACEQQDAAAQILDGSVQPNCFDGGPRWCDNAIDWDTSSVPDGVYWIYAVNTDPPFHIYNISEAPVRVSHGPRRPAIVIVVRPGGGGPSADASYRTGVLVEGEGALTLDLAWGVNETAEWRAPLHRIATGIAATPGADGTVAYDWDTRAMAAGTFYLGATVTDDGGLVTFTNSRFGASVFHRMDLAQVAPADLAAPLDAPAGDPPDAAASTDGPGGCGCALGAAPRSASSTSTALFHLWAAATAVALRLSRRGSRRGSRSGCTR